MSEHVLMAILGKPQGIKGDVRAFTYADALILPKGSVTLCKSDEPDRHLTLVRCRPHSSEKGGNIVCGFAEITDRTQAETLYQASIYVPTSSLPKLNEEEVYLHEMLGLTVVLHETGQTLGVLDHVMFHSSQEVWSISTPDGKEVLLPAVPEFINDIDLDTEIIRITPPEGLLELYLEK